MTSETFPVRAVIAVALLAAALCPAVLLAQASQPADTQPAAALAPFYGFGEMEILKLQWGMGLPLVADVNGDGLSDLVITNNHKARIELLLQKKDFKAGEDLPMTRPAGEEDVNDLFGREQYWRFKRVAFDLDVEASSLTVADLNHDGLCDLAYYSAAGLFVVLQRPLEAGPRTAPAKDAGPRSPLWHSPRKFDIREGLAGAERALAAGDLNGDGRMDLALLAADGVFLLLQKDDGTLDKPLKYPTSAKSPRQLSVADLNNDGRADLLVLTAEKDMPLWARFQNSAGKLGPEVPLKLPLPAVLQAVNLGAARKTVLADVSALSGRVGIWTLKADPQVASHPVYSYPLPAGEASDKRDMVAADVDGDGRLDVVVSEPGRAQFILFRASEKNSLSAGEEFPGLMDMQKLRAGDLDGSKKDAIVALSLQEKLIGISRLEKGRLSYPQSVQIQGEPLAMDLADMDGDGTLDLVYLSKEKDKDQDKYFLRVINSLGRPKAAASGELALTELKDKPLDVRCADVDGDGRSDVLVVQPYGPILLVRQAQAGKYQQVTGADVHAGLVSNVPPAALSIAPLGPKASTALLLAQKQFARALVFQGEKGWQVVDQYPAPSPLSNLTAAAACRMAEGGPMNIVAYDSSREKLAILAPQADGTYQTAGEVEVGGLTARKILVGNFGGPSALSILLCGPQRLIRVPLAEQTVQLARVASFEPDIKDSRFGALAVGDLNGDGCPDIALADQAGNHVEILTFNADGRLTPASRFKVFEQPRNIERDIYREGRGKEGGEPRAILIADVTGDGKPDLILAVHDRIIVYPQD